MDEVDDEALVAAARAGGPEAFGDIVRRYQGAVFSVAVARLRDFHEAEDVAQMVFVDAYQQLDRLQEPSRLGPWLRTMAINKSLDRLRRRRTTGPSVAVDVASIENDRRHAVAPAEEESDGRGQVLAALSRLPAAQRETLTLHYLSDCSVREIARIQGAPDGTVKIRLHRGRKALKREMMEMVESTLTQEGPPEDLAQRVYETLTRFHRSRHELLVELQRAGAERGDREVIRGMERAASSDSVDLRRQAIYFAVLFAEGEAAEEAFAVVRRGLEDENRFVRVFAVTSLYNLPPHDRERRREFVPLLVDRLFDRAVRVRQRTAGLLEDWAQDVPMADAARALLAEDHPRVRPAMENLLRTVVEVQAGPDPRPPQGDELERLRQRLGHEKAGIRCQAVARLLHLALINPRRKDEVLALVMPRLRDPSRRVRWRTAMELGSLARDLDRTVVEQALARETHPNVRPTLEGLLQKATG